jgi:uncharacterized protein YwgA
MDGRHFEMIGRIIGKDAGIKTFRDRLIVQKMTYLLKSAGVAPDYFYSWYVRGPYSIAVSNDSRNYYGSSDKFSGELTQKEADVVNRMRAFLSDDLRDLDRLDQKLELYGSLLFLHDEKKLELGSQELVSLLKYFKPWFTIEEIQAAANKIKGSGLFN